MVFACKIKPIREYFRIFIVKTTERYLAFNEIRRYVSRHLVVFLFIPNSFFNACAYCMHKVCTGFAQGVRYISAECACILHLAYIFALQDIYVSFCTVTMSECCFDAQLSIRIFAMKIPSFLLVSR